MVSRETSVHVLSVIVGIAALAVFSATGVTETGAGQALSVALFYAFSLGGAHLYFALRGEGGTVPVRSRWRFVGLVGAIVALVAVWTAVGQRAVWSATIQTVTAWLLGLLVLAYFVVEGVAGYRQSRQEP